MKVTIKNKQHSGLKMSSVKTRTTHSQTVSNHIVTDEKELIISNKHI
jgi:hypothetical protein